MVAFILRRVALGIVTVAVAVIIVFFLEHLTSGSPGETILGVSASRAQIDALNNSLGWNRPLLVQLADYVVGLLHGNLGTSWVDNSSVAATTMTRLEVTASISLIATILAGVIGTGLGTLAVVRGGLLDRAISAANGVAMSLPMFWIAVVLAYVLAVALRWLPATGYVQPGSSLGGWAASVTLPVVALAIGPVAVIARTARAALTQTLHQSSALMLRSVGTSPSRLLLVHSLRAASIPIVSVIGLLFISVFSGSIVIENFFGLPGLGPEISTAITFHNIPVIEGVVVVTACIIVVVVLILDLVVGALDPRVRRT